MSDVMKTVTDHVLLFLSEEGCWFLDDEQDVTASADLEGRITEALQNYKRAKKRRADFEWAIAEVQSLTVEGSDDVVPFLKIVWRSRDDERFK